MKQIITKRPLCLILVLILTAALFFGCSAGEIGGKVEPLPSGESTGSNVALGRMEGGVYTNEYAGFGCKLDENWEFATAEELQELPNNINEILADTSIAEGTAKLNQIMDMQAENTTDMMGINVLYQKLDMNVRLASMTMTEEDVIDQTLALKDSMVESYANAGIIVDTMEKVTVTFLGEEHVALRTCAVINNIPYYTLQIMDYHLGVYAVTLTASSFVMDTTEDVLALFYAV